MENAEVNTPADLGVELVEREAHGGNGVVQGVFPHVPSWFMTVLMAFSSIFQAFSWFGIFISRDAPLDFTGVKPEAPESAQRAAASLQAALQRGSWRSYTEGDELKSRMPAPHGRGVGGHLWGPQLLRLCPEAAQQRSGHRAAHGDAG